MTDAIETVKKPADKRIRRQVEHLRERIESCSRFAEEAMKNGDLKEQEKMLAERAAAERMLHRRLTEYDLTGLGADAAQAEPRSFLWNPGAWAGEKYTAEVRRMSVVEIAKLIRADIRIAQVVGRKSAGKDGEVTIPDPIGDAPRAIKVRTRSRHHTSIEVVLENIPREWGFVRGEDRWGHQREVPSEALVELLRALEAIHDAYNYSNSEIQTDYFEQHYWGGVYVASETGGLTSYSTDPYAYRRY